MKGAKLIDNLDNCDLLFGVKEVDVREQTWLSMRLLERVRLHLSSIVETGEMAKKVKEYRI